MQRIALSTLPLCGVAASLALVLASTAPAQTPDQEEVPEIVAVVGAPFSAVATQQNIRVTPDGNRFIHTITTHHYRDGQGRTRLERDLQLPGFNANSAAAPIPHILVTIHNKVTGEVDSILPSLQMATVMQRTVKEAVEAPGNVVPEIFTNFGGMHLGPKQPGWSAPVSLGEKSIEGVHVVGTQKIYTMAAGTVGNEKAITITVQQWSSTDLGVIVDKTVSASTGGQSHYQLQQILQAEPSADLFRVPAGYKTKVVNIRNGTVIAAGNTSSTTATAQQ